VLRCPPTRTRSAAEGGAEGDEDCHVNYDKPDPYAVPPARPDDFAERQPSEAPAAFAIGSQAQPVIEVVSPYVRRERTWAFVVDEHGQPIELGAGRFAKAYLGEERWLQSKTTLKRPAAIKCLQRGVVGDDVMRFQAEKEILERVQGHPNIVELFGSGEAGSPGCSDAFLPPAVRDKLVNDFMVLELLDLSLEERLKGARHKRRRDDLLAVPMPERLFRVLDYVLPVACAVEFAHLVRNISHRDIKPANILLKLPDTNLRGSQMKVKLADFNVAVESANELAHLRYQPVPGTMYFQSPEQETNTVELLVNCTRGSAEISFFQDFYMDIFRNDTFSLFNRDEHYTIVGADRAHKRLLLDRPFGEPDEINVRGRIVKAVGRPADIYSLGALLYYLISGAYGNPKTLFDTFRRFVEFDRNDDSNTIAAYLDHEYGTIQNIRAPKLEGGAPEMAYEDKFFSYKQYLDGNGELIDRAIMMICAKAMIRNKPDSYCMSYDLETTGISAMVHDLLALSVMYGVDPNARLARTSAYQPPKKSGFDKLFR
jgi:serine/threonine protein kinase